MKATHLIPITLLIWPYMVIPLFLDIFDSTSGSIYFIVYALSTVVVYLLNIVHACLLSDVHQLAFWNMVLKLAHIPFFLAVFFFGIGIMVAIPLLFVIDAALMVTTSAYGIKAGICAHKQHHLSLEHTVLLSLGHLLFVTDVICSIITYTRLGKHKE